MARHYMWRLFASGMKRSQLNSKVIIATVTISLLGMFIGRNAFYEDLSSHSKFTVGEGNQSKTSVDERMTEIEDKIAILERRFWLENLEPIFNFRPKFGLGKTKNVEDKDQVIPYFLANFVDTTAYPRRIYIDLGIKDFESSLCWIMQHYPTKFDVIYGFECARDFSNVAELAVNVEHCIKGTAAEVIGYNDVAETLDSMTLYYNYVGLDDDPGTSPPTKGLSKFLSDAGIQKEDFVVVKMDVEGVEFSLIERLLADGTYKLIDELFVEIHYKHPDMSPWGWNQFSHSRSEAQALFTKARDAGMFIHPWP